MSFLDRFKSQPKYKSAEPDVRLAGVQEIGDTPEEHEALVALAREDTDARVRRSAAARITDAVILAGLAAGDPDEDIRREIADRLATIAADDDPAAAAAALGALTNQKQIGTVAKTSPVEEIRLEAVGRLTDLKALSSVARNAADARVAAIAADHIQDPAELLNVAARTDHKDVGMSALERAAAAGPTDRQTLDDLAERAKNKSVARRARMMVQAMDEAEAARRSALEEQRRRLAAALARIEALAEAAAGPSTGGELVAAEAEWRELAPSAEAITPDDQSRFDAAAARVRDAIARAEAEAARQREHDERVEAGRRARASLCERVDALRGDDAVERIAEARAEWEGLPAAEEDPEAEAHRARFEESCRRATERHANRQEFEKANARLDELAREAEQLAAQEEPPAYAWESISREWHDLRGRIEGTDETVLQRFAQAETTIRERADAKRAAAEKTLRQQVQRIEQLIDRVHKRAEAEDLTLREADKAARDLRAALDAPPALPPQEREALVERVRAALGAVGPRLHELREMDEWKRFANAAVQEELIAHTEALKTKYDLEKPEDLDKVAKEMHEIQERWKLAAEAPRAQAQALWHRYRQAADPIQAKLREFFSHRAEERDTNLQKKLALCEHAEALADSSEWIKTADELKKLQAEWQATGPVPRAEAKVVWKRFRDACDRFFTRRNEDLAQRKEVWSANQARKEALCARAEELADSREWDKAASELRRLQAEWKTVGPVRRSKSEVLWNRFRAACDHFFERYKRRDEIDLEARAADREALAVELESLLPAEGEAPAAPPDLLDRVRSLRSRWNQSTPAVRHGSDPLSPRFVSAIERLLTAYPDAFKGTELDVDASRQRMEKLCARVESFVSEIDSKQAATPQDLATMLREALAANTIGGRAGDETKWRTMAEEVRQAQSSFARLVPVPGDAGRDLAERFHKACNRFFDQYRRKVPPPQQSAPRGRPVGTR